MGPEREWFCPECEAAAVSSDSRQNFNIAAPLSIVAGEKELEWIQMFEKPVSLFNSLSSGIIYNLRSASNWECCSGTPCGGHCERTPA